MTPEEIIYHNRKTIEQNLQRPLQYRAEKFVGKTMEEMQDMIDDAEYLERLGFKNKLKSEDFLP